MKATTSIAAACLLPLCSAAEACMSRYDHDAYIHRALPDPLPSGAFIAEVELGDLREDLDARELMLGPGLRARIHRLVQGGYRGRDLLVRPTQVTSCDDIFGNGRRGLIVAIPRGVEEGTLVVDPITAHSAAGYRLPDGFQIDPERAARGALPATAGEERSEGAPPDRLFPLATAAAIALAAAIRAILVRRRRRGRDGSR